MVFTQVVKFAEVISAKRASKDIMMVKSAQPGMGRGGGACPPTFTLSTITSTVVA